MTVGTNYFTAQTANVNVAFTDPSGNASLIACSVANLPTGAGYSLGCLAITSDNGKLYYNQNGATTASFVLV